jgi:hypothetical protein
VIQRADDVQNSCRFGVSHDGDFSDLCASA